MRLRLSSLVTRVLMLNSQSDLLYRLMGKEYKIDLLLLIFPSEFAARLQFFHDLFDCCLDCGIRMNLGWWIVLG